MVFIKIMNCYLVNMFMLRMNMLYAVKTPFLSKSNQKEQVVFCHQLTLRVY